MWTGNTKKIKKKGRFVSLCRVSPSAPAAFYKASFHVEVPASSTEPQRAPTARSLCRGDPINTVSSPFFSLLAVWLRRAAFMAGIQSYSNMRARLGRRDPTHHYRSDETLRIFLYFTSRSAPGDAVSSEQFQKNLLLFQSGLMVKASSALL